MFVSVPVSIKKGLFFLHVFSCFFYYNICTPVRKVNFCQFSSLLFMIYYFSLKILMEIKEIKLKHLGLNHNIGAKSVDFT